MEQVIRNILDFARNLDFKGCVSCLACKLNNAKSTGCVQRDELPPVLDKILQDVDVLLLGSPVYFTSMSAGMRAFYERAAYPYLPTNEQGSKFPKKIKVGLILTIGANEKLIYDMGMNKHFELTEMMMGFIFGSAESLIVTEASLTQDGDYAKYGFSSEMAAEAKLRNEESANNGAFGNLLVCTLCFAEYFCRGAFRPVEQESYDTGK